MSVPGRIGRAPALASLFVAAFVAAATSARAKPPLPSAAVAEQLASAAKLDGAPGLLRLLRSLEHLDALTPEAALAALTEIAARATPAGERARLELAALTGAPAPDGVLVAGLAAAELAPDGELLALHRTLSQRGKAVSGQMYDEADPDRVWVRVGEGPLGALALDPLVVAGGRVVVHALVPFEVATAGPEELFLGATGDLALSLVSPQGATFLGVARALEKAAPDQLAIPLGALSPGRHALLLTLRPNAAEPALLRVRIAAAKAVGETGALTWPAFDVPVDGPALPWNPAVQALNAGRTTIDGLVLARLLGLPDLAGDKRDAPAVALEDRLAAARLPPIELLLALGAVRRPEDHASLLLARLGDVRDPTLLLALAEHTAARGQLVQAGALVAEAAALDKDGKSAALVTFMRTRLARLAQTPEEVLVRYELTAAGFDERRLAAEPERVRLEIAQAALDLGRADMALSIVAALAARHPGRLDLALTEARTALAAGAGERAVDLAQALAERRPDRPTLALDAAAKLLARNAAGDHERARTLVSRALDRLRWKPDPLVDAGRLLESLGDRPAAVAAYVRALEVSPAHDDARRDLERLQGVEPVPLTLTIEGVARRPVVDAAASFEVLGEEHVVKVRSDGSATHWKRRILRAQTVPEAREARSLYITFDPTQESVRVLSATVRRERDAGTTFEPVPERILQSVAEDWYGLYYDLRQLAVPFDRIQRGDIVEVTWRIDPVGQLFPGVVDLFEVLLDRVPKHQHRIVVETPAGIALTTRLSTPDGMKVVARETTEALPQGGTRHVLEASDLPGLPAEKLAPGTAEVSPVWQATTFASWREAATWYRRLVEPQKVLTGAMKAFVANARANKATPGEVLARLHDYVTRQIRYVGLEFGIHGFKPYRADQVWARRFGDCKDKATLLSALLAEAGIASEVTLVRTRRQGRLDDALPSLALFNHAVLYLPGRDEIVDATATHYGLGELPKDDQGAQILVLTPPSEPAALVVSRVDPAARNGVTGTYSVTLESRGGAGIQGTVAFLGTQAPPYRSMLLDPASQKSRLAELMNRRFPGLSLRDFRVSDPLASDKPFELVFHAEVPRFGQLRSEADGTLFVTRPTGVDGHLERFASEDARRLPLVLGPPQMWDVTYRYILPDGHRARGVPAGGEGSGRYGSYKVTWIDEGQVVTVRTELTYLVDQVGPADYAGLRDFVRAFDAAVAPPLVLEKAAAR